MSLLKSNSNKNNKSNKPENALTDFKSSIINSTEKIIKEYLPIKIVQLTELFDEISSKQTETEKKKYNYSNNNAMDMDNNNNNNNNNKNKNTNSKSSKSNKTNKKKRAFNEINFDDNDNNNNNNKQIELKNNIYCSTNEEIEKLNNLIKIEVKELINYLDQIALFINLHIPAIEDGNNFGVQIQEQMKSMVSNGQISAQDFLRNIPKFHSLRAKLISKIMKYPNLEDYKISIIELDYKQLLMLKHCLRDLRNNYWILHDVLTKNWNKIIKPKGDKTATFNMY
eukprot:285445_1